MACHGGECSGLFMCVSKVRQVYTNLILEEIRVIGNKKVGESVLKREEAESC